MKRILFVLGLFISLSVTGQITYPSSVFWQFLEGYQAGDSSTQKYLEYKNGFLLLETNQRDAKVFQARNELNDIGISTIFIDANGNGGIGVDSSNGGTVVKLRGALSDHSYINNTHVSIGRGGQTQDYGGNVDGAKFTVSDDREPGYGLWDANNYQIMLQSSKDSIGGYVGLAFTSENATQDKNVGAFINYLKTGNNGKGELHFGTKTATGSLADGIHAMKIYDGSVTIDSTIVLPNLYTGTSDTTLIISNDTIYKKVSSSDNIYTADGTLTGDRTVTMDGNELIFEGTHSFNYDLKITDLAITLPSNSATLSSTFTRAADGAILSMRNNSNTEHVLLRSYASGGVQGHFTAGKIGIGTSTPSASLHIIGSEQCNLIVESTITGSGIDFVDNTTSAYNQVGIGALGDNLCFRAGGVLNMRLTAAGNLGIGTTSPSARLHADNTETSGVGAIIENSDVTNTDDIAKFHNSTGTVASITNDGGIVASIPTGTSDTSLVISNDTIYKRVNQKQGIVYYCNPDDVVAASTTEYNTFTGSQNFISIEDRRAILVPSDGVFSDFYVNHGSSPAGGSTIITVRKNGVNTSLTVTISSGAAAGFVSDTVNSFTVSAGDVITIQYENTFASNSARIQNTSILFTPN